MSTILKSSKRIALLAILLAFMTLLLTKQFYKVTPSNTGSNPEAKSSKKLLVKGVEESSSRGVVEGGERVEVAFLSTPDAEVFRGDNGLMLFPEINRIERDPVKGSVFEGNVFELKNGEATGELTYTEKTKSAVESKMDLAQVRAFLSSDAQYLSVPVSASKSVLLDIQRVEEQGTHTVTLVGEIKDRPFTEVRMVFHDGAVAGSVELLDEVTYYQYGMAGNGDVAIRLLDMEKNIYGDCAHCDETHVGNPHVDALFDERSNDVVTPLQALDEPISETLTSDSFTHVIDGVITYTTPAKNQAGGAAAIEATTLLSIGFCSAALENSAITDTIVVLLGTAEEVGHNKGLVATFNELRNSELRASDLRFTLGADFMGVIYNGGSGVAELDGLSLVAGNTSLGNSADAIVHEFGHLLGCLHSWGDNSGGTSTHTNISNFGWRFRAEDGTRTRTVMSYTGGWANLRIGYYSNPEVSFRGVPTGVVDGYDASGDATDPQLINGGAIGGLGPGYDGSNPSLGANNSRGILNNRRIYSNNSVRSSKVLVSPLGGNTYFVGRDQLVSWRGGDSSQSAEIDLYKGGVFHSKIASFTGAHELNYNWVIPDVTPDNDYTVRVSFEGEAPFSSTPFEIQFIEAFADDIAIVAIDELPKNITLPSIPDVTFDYSYTQPANGTLTGTPPNLVYTANPNAVSDSFRYSITLDGGSAESASVSIQVASEVAYWPLDEITGSVIEDASGNEHHGNLISGSWLPEGQRNGALEFDGTSDSASLPLSAFNEVENEMTLSIWVNGDIGQSSADSVFTMLDGGDNYIQHIRMGFEINGVYRNYWTSCVPLGCNTLFKDFNENEVKGEWNHYVFVKNADTGVMKIYLNGALETQLLNFLPIGDAAFVYLGRGKGTDNNYSGMIDNIRLYNTEMTSESVTALYSMESATAPVARDLNIKVSSNSSTYIALSSDTPTASYSIVGYPDNGFLHQVGQSWVYTPNTGFTGADSFSFYGTSYGISGAPATVSIEVVSSLLSSTGYHAIGNEVTMYRSTGTNKSFDLDTDEVYGTAGYFFYGDGVNSTANSNGMPSWVTSVEALASSTVASNAYTRFDSPSASISDSVADVTRSTIGLVNTSSAGTWAELLAFSIDESAPKRFRVGVLAGNESSADGRWDPSGLRLSFGDGEAVEIVDLEVTNLGLVLFDVLLSNNESRRLVIEGQTRSLGSTTRGPSIAGITLDEIPGTPQAYTAWISEYPGVLNVSEAIDADGDGIVNSLEFALGGNPSVADQSILPILKPSSDGFDYAFTRLEASIEDFTLVFQYSSTLGGDWLNVPLVDSEASGVSVQPMGNGMEAINISIDDNFTTEPQLFGRLLLTPNTQ